MTLTEITPMILTFNERENIECCLQHLQWAREVLVVDSLSTDGTLDLARTFPNVRIVSRPFDSLANQANFGLSEIATPWVLSLDADYVVPEEFVKETSKLNEKRHSGFAASFIYQVFGRPLRGTLYPPRKVLYRKECARYRNDGHAHRLELTGHCGELLTPLVHNDRKSLSRWFSSQAAYAALEAVKLRETPKANLRLTDRIRQLRFIAPWANLAIVLFRNGAILDGWPGWYYATQRLIAELMISVSLQDHDLRAKTK